MYYLVLIVDILVGGVCFMIGTKLLLDVFGTKIMASVEVTLFYVFCSALLLCAAFFLVVGVPVMFFAIPR